MNISRTLALLQKCFPDGPPADREVRAQTEEFLATHWIKRWPGELQMPDFLEKGARLSVSRQQLFDIAAEVKTPEDALGLYVWMAGWGAGVKARPTARCVKVLHNPDVVETLWCSFASVRELGAVEAYRRLRRGGPNSLSGFGPSFFTKWMYFAAYDTWEIDSYAPLILDVRVAEALGNPGWKNWPASYYESYLADVDEIRKTWAPDATPHAIERALFVVGGKLRSERKNK